MRERETEMAQASNGNVNHESGAHMRNEWLDCEKSERRGTSTGSKEAQAEMGKHPHGLTVFRISITGEEELIQDLSASFMFPNDKGRGKSREGRQILKLLLKYFVIS